MPRRPRVRNVPAVMAQPSTGSFWRARTLRSPGFLPAVLIPIMLPGPSRFGREIHRRIVWRGKRARHQGSGTHPFLYQRHEASGTGMNQLPNSLRSGPDATGHFGAYGGRFVAETLMPLIL